MSTHHAIIRATRNAHAWGAYAAAVYMVRHGANPRQVTAALNFARWLHPATIPTAN